MSRLTPLSPKSDWDFASMNPPLFDPIRAVAAPFIEFTRWPTIAELQQVAPPPLNESGVALTLERQVKTKRKRKKIQRSRDDIYDARIDGLALLPTREACWHDFFNWMVWLAFPRSKARISFEQHRLLRSRVDEVFTALPSRRLPEQDALTILDEGGILLLRNDSEERPIVFGHALYEHFVSSSEPVRAAYLVLDVSDFTNACADESLRARLLDGRFAADGSITLHK